MLFYFSVLALATMLIGVRTAWFLLNSHVSVVEIYKVENLFDAKELLHE